MLEIIKSNNLIILDAYWFSGGGAVIGQDQITREYKAYIMGLEDIGERDEKNDAKYIAQWGDKLPLDVTEKMFPNINQSRDWIEDHPEYFI